VYANGDRVHICGDLGAFSLCISRDCYNVARKEETIMMAVLHVACVVFFSLLGWWLEKRFHIVERFVNWAFGKEDEDETDGKN